MIVDDKKNTTKQKQTVAAAAAAAAKAESLYRSKLRKSAMRRRDGTKRIYECTCKPAKPRCWTGACTCEHTGKPWLIEPQGCMHLRTYRQAMVD